jgi:alpha-L-rhamnosidase
MKTICFFALGLLSISTLAADTVQNCIMSGVWIENAFNTTNAYAGFSGKFTWSKGQKAILKVTAANSYRACANGHFVSTGPAHSPKGFLRVDERDITEFLHEGENIISVEVSSYCNERCFSNFPHPPQAAFQVEVDNKCVIWTSPCGKGGVTGKLLKSRIAKVPFFSFQRTWIEEYSLQKDSFNWRKKGLNTGDKLVAAEQVKYITRTVPELDFPIANNFKPLKNAKGVYYDCGRLITGHIGFAIRAHSKCTVEAAFTEWPKNAAVDPERSIWINKKTKAKTIQTNARIILHFEEPGIYEFESIEPYSLRAIQFNSALKDSFEVATKPYVRLVENPATKIAHMKSEDPVLDTIFAAAAATFAQNAVDAYTDCPSRERAGWNGDSFFLSRANEILSGDLSYDVHFLENFLLPPDFDPLPKGVIPMCYPASTKGRFIINWGNFFVMQLEEFTTRSGNRYLADSLKKRVDEWFEYLAKNENEDGLIEPLPSWAFIEWSAAQQFADGVSYPANMIYASALKSAAKLYKDDAREKKANYLIENIRNQSFNGRFFRDHAVRENGALCVRPDATETAQFYALFTGVASKERDGTFFKRVIEDLGPCGRRNELYPEMPAAGTFLGNTVRLDVLSRNGEDERTLNEIKVLFASQASKTLTLWETENDASSLCHGFAGYSAYLIVRSIMGLDKIDFKNRTIIMRHTNGTLPDAEITLPLNSAILKFKRLKGKVACEESAGFKVIFP